MAEVFVGTIICNKQASEGASFKSILAIIIVVNEGFGMGLAVLHNKSKSLYSIPKVNEHTYSDTRIGLLRIFYLLQQGF
jgi:hypothetical protein